MDTATRREPSVFFTVLIKVKIKKKKPTQLSTLSHAHDTAPQRDSSTNLSPQKIKNETLRVDFGVMEWGVMRAAIPLGCCVVGVAES